MEIMYVYRFVNLSVGRIVIHVFVMICMER